MAGPDTRGSVFRTRKGDYGIRWPEAGKRPQKTGFRTKTDAREWFAGQVAPRVRDGAPDASITFDAFCDLYLDRWGATVAKRTKETVEERLASSRKQFGDWTLRELEGAAADIAKWRAELSATSRFRSDARDAPDPQCWRPLALPEGEPSCQCGCKPCAAVR